MNIAGSPEPNPWWQGRSHLLLAGHLLLLHALAFGGWQLPAVRILWFVALGLFLIWQPFVAGEQRMSALQGSMLLRPGARLDLVARPVADTGLVRRAGGGHRRPRAVDREGGWNAPVISAPSATWSA